MICSFPVLAQGHRRHIQRGVRLQRLLFALVILIVLVEVAMGCLIWSALSRVAPVPAAPPWPWFLLLALAGAIQAALAFVIRARLLRPGPLVSRLERSLQKTDLAGVRLSPEMLTVVAVRAGFVADVIAWSLLQFITVYGLVLVVLGAGLPWLFGFAAVALATLGAAAPSVHRLEALAEALHETAAR